MMQGEPQEIEPLLQFYRVRYHQMSDNMSVQDRLLREAQGEIEELKKELLKLQKSNPSKGGNIPKP